MNRPFNVGVVGYRGSGKTTLCYRLMGIDPPQKPNGTTSLDYMTCNWDNKYTILAWDFTPGVSPHTEQHINDMQCIVLCCDGRNNRSSVSALQFLSTQTSRGGGSNAYDATYLVHTVVFCRPWPVGKKAPGSAVLQFRRRSDCSHYPQIFEAVKNDRCPAVSESARVVSDLS